jgi:hypothetical protein
LRDEYFNLHARGQAARGRLSPEAQSPASAGGWIDDDQWA